MAFWFVAMSRRSTPSSLATLATDVIATIVLPAVQDSIPPEGVDGLPEDQNPFANLGPAVTQYLIEQLLRKRGQYNLTCLQLEILLCRGGVKKLDLFLTSEFLARREAMWFHRMFSCIGRLGESLVDLSLEFYLTCNNEELCSMLSKLPNLRYFLVAFENLSDRVLETLGHRCRHLKKLILCETPQVTDAGFRALVSEAGTEGCLNLNFISAEGAPIGVTVSSVVYLLERLLLLEALHLPHLNKALVVLNEIKPPGYRLALREYKDVNVFVVQTSVRPTMREFLFKTVELCPKLSTVEVEVKTSDDISPLRLLTGLSNFSVRTSEPTSEWFFYTQLEPVLQEAGAKLTSLKLVMPDVDLTAVDTACPYIKTLHFASLNMCWRRSGIKGREKPFSDLDTLHLDPEGPHSIKVRDLNQLFADSVGLRNLTLGSCDSFDDMFLMDALQKGLFRNLARIEFHNLGKVTILGIQQMVLLDEHLESLTLKDCTALSADDLAFLTGSSYMLKFQLKVPSGFNSPEHDQESVPVESGERFRSY